MVSCFIMCEFFLFILLLVIYLGSCFGWKSVMNVLFRYYFILKLRLFCVEMFLIFCDVLDCVCDDNYCYYFLYGVLYGELYGGWVCCKLFVFNGFK